MPDIVTNSDIKGVINIADFILTISTHSPEHLDRLREIINQALPAVKKVNKIAVEGDNNIIIQDVNGSTIAVDKFVESLTGNVLHEIFQKHFDNYFKQSNFSNNTLYVLILALDGQTLNKQLENTDIAPFVDFNDYGQTHYQWKPYKNQQTILELLAQFKVYSGIEIVFIDHEKTIENDDVSDDFCEVMHQVVFIVDAISLYNSTLFDKTISACGI